ncbi:CDP-alcohol phosphatidyltransferase family protein [uncultured Aliiroseovarius sp.]|uniref:CDP-alcohol phosphatidyltransferase family protein n=1 Tax=uncultured Aliiroseovarius sp. TaxID=1658783 RepID=UPI002608BA26|nr:CDP-alcohol phosphatidyltransferase family protein [uncultured Aliiroseovarius sp.]
MKRFQINYFGKAESWIVPRMVRALPRWVTPDMMTLLSLVGAGLASYGMVKKGDVIWGLVLLICGLLLNWIGDSSDGALARLRNRQRPILGFWIDRAADTICFVLLFVSLGASPYLNMGSGLGLAGAYLFFQLASLNLARRNRIALIGYGGLGATEARLLIAFSVTIQYVLISFDIRPSIGPLPLDACVAAMFSFGMATAGVRLLSQATKHTSRKRVLS